jgi:uncharacterized protein
VTTTALETPVRIERNAVNPLEAEVLGFAPGPVLTPTGRTVTTAPPAVAETHCATVFFAGDRAYKVKKPLDLGFVDFRAPESRHRACRRELELNRRFAPDVYLDVAAIGPDGGEPCEWAVVMRRMPSERRLSTLISSGADVTDSVRHIARQLAAHHASTRRSPRIDEAGGPLLLRT